MILNDRFAGIALPGLTSGMPVDKEDSERFIYTYSSSFL